MSAARPAALAAVVVALALSVACGGDGSGPATGNVTGVVRDTASNPLEGITIEIRNPGTTTVVRSVMTSAAGAYTAVGLAAGSYDVFAQTPTATQLTTPATVTVNVTGGASAQANFTFRLLPVLFATHVRPLLAASCGTGGCHGNTDPQQGMFLTADSAYKYTVNVPSTELPAMDRIEPNDPDQSYLIHKVQGTQASVGGTGLRMPQGAPALGVQTIQMLRRWVTAGALNN